MKDYDLVVRGGLIVDGTGSAPFEGDVAVQDGKIVEVGQVRGEGAREIDAAGRIVTPGFIDIHTHYDGQATWENRMSPSSHHGVTTVLMGNCGVGFAPCRPHERDMLVKLMEGVEDIPEVVMVDGLPWNWETFPDYLDALDQRRFDVDVATQVPHSALRIFVMGERAARREAATRADLAQMRELVGEAVRAGAFGVSTSRNVMHRTRRGKRAPSLYSQTDELCALMDGLNDADAGVFQLIPSPIGDVNDEWAVIRAVAEHGRRPLSFSLLDTPLQQGGWRRLLEGLDEARRDGLAVKGQVAPRPVGMFFGLDLSLHPFSSHPSYRSIAGLSLAERVACMRDPEVRKKFLAECPDDSNPVTLNLIDSFRLSHEWHGGPDYEPRPDTTMELRARDAGLSVAEFAYDRLLEDEGRRGFYLPAANYTCGDLSAVRDMLDHPGTLVGLADGGAHYGMICDASFPTYYLQRWVRDADETERIPLAEAVAELTARPAEAVGMIDRGRITRGFKGDLNIIDVQALKLYAPTVVYDLPAGGKRMQQKTDGFVATIVSGVITYLNGEPTGALPGRLLRRGINP